MTTHHGAVKMCHHSEAVACPEFPNPLPATALAESPAGVAVQLPPIEAAGVLHNVPCAPTAPKWGMRIGRYKLPRVRLHDLRHSYASLMLESGVDLKTVSTALGHSTIRVTADTYAHVSPAMLQSAAARLDRIIGGERARSR